MAGDTGPHRSFAKRQFRPSLAAGLARGGSAANGKLTPAARAQRQRKSRPSGSGSPAMTRGWQKAREDKRGHYGPFLPAFEDQRTAPVDGDADSSGEASTAAAA